jgi:hypothetical protein
MKNILLSTIMLITVYGTVKAQTDFCKDIKKTVTDNAVLYTSPTPGEGWAKGVFMFNLIKAIDGNGAQIYLQIAHKSDDATLTSSDLSIKFDDNNEISYTAIPVKREESGESGKYLYTSVLKLSSADMDKFKTKKFKNFSFVGATATPFIGNFKTKIMAYANCMDSFTEGFTPVVNANEKKSIDGFWGIKFGASVDEISAAMKAKGAKLHPESSDANALVYAGVQFTQRDVSQINMKFVEAKFYEATVNFPAPEESQVLSQFQTITNELVGVYGEGKLTKAFEPPYTDGDGYTVSAIKLGKASYFYLWKTNNGNTIQLQINKDLSMALFYTDKTLEKLKTTKKSSDY